MKDCKQVIVYKVTGLRRGELLKIASSRVAGLDLDADSVKCSVLF